MIVQKYGGSSLATFDKMRQVAQRIMQAKQEHHRVIVVVSAMGKTTNQLLELAQSAAVNPTKREVDMLLSTGEQVSSALLSMILNEAGIQALSLNGFQAGIHTEGNHTKTKIRDIDLSNITRYLDQGSVVLITGFQGYNPHVGDITTLGRGGSDTTAVALAAKYGCACEIYTDVSGIHTLDPSRFPAAKKLDVISYEEMCELAYQGARVMETRAVEIARKFAVPLKIAAAHKPCTGTWIKENDSMIEQKHITGVSVKDAIVMMSLHRLPTPDKSVADLFSSLAEKEINVDMISQTVIEDDVASIAFTCDAEEIDGVQATLLDLGKRFPGFKLVVDDQLAKVSVVGLGMRTQSGVAASVFKLLSQNDIPFKLVTTSDISISYTIPKAKTEQAVALIARQFDL